MKKSPKSRLKWFKERGQESYTGFVGGFELDAFKNVEEWRWYWIHVQVKPCHWDDNHGTAPDLESAKLAAEASVRAFVAKHFTLPEVKA